MKLHVLGNNGPFPAPGGATSGYLLESSGTFLCLDMGSGVLQALTRRMPPENLDALFLTHWHYDHCADTLPLLYRLQATGKTLRVYAPEDDQAAVRGILRQDPGIELMSLNPGDSLTIGDVQIRVFRAVHPVKAVMLRMTSLSEGKVFCYTGDTNLCDDLGQAVQDADLLLADGLFPEKIWDSHKPHLSARLCAQLAVQAGVRRLVITHLNPMIPSQTLLEEARAVFPEARLSSIGETYEF